MPEFKKGDKVLATRNLGGWWTPAVPQGTTGEVIRVETSFCWPPIFTVKFDNGTYRPAYEDDLYGVKEKPAEPKKDKPKSCWWSS